MSWQHELIWKSKHYDAILPFRSKLRREHHERERERADDEERWEKEIEVEAEQKTTVQLANCLRRSPKTRKSLLEQVERQSLRIRSSVEQSKERESREREGEKDMGFWVRLSLAVITSIKLVMGRNLRLRTATVDRWISGHQGRKRRLARKGGERRSQDWNDIVTESSRPSGLSNLLIRIQLSNEEHLHLLRQHSTSNRTT